MWPATVLVKPCLERHRLVVEHPRIPFISYVYEWPFEMLRAAAIRSLEILQLALEKDLILKDATPYNVQFIGTNPLLIDVGSFERYQEGMPWIGYTPRERPLQ